MSVVNKIGKYNNLLKIIGTIYGVGNNVSTFNIPDIKGRIIIGSG